MVGLKKYNFVNARMSKIVVIMRKVVKRFHKNSTNEKSDDLDMISDVLALFATHFANICPSSPFLTIVNC